jgi:hypothetical protein
MPANITGAIMSLPRPTTFNFSFARSWSAEATTLWGPMFSNGSFDPINDQSTSSGIWQIAQALSGASLEAAARADYKRSVNQRNEVLFQDLPFRDVSLSWNLRPRSQAQAATWVDAIRYLEIYSAPTLVKSEALWDVKDCIFKLEFPLLIEPAGGGPPKPQYLFRSGELVITNINKDYAPQGFWSQHKDNMPTQINLTIQMQELELAYRDGNKLRGHKESDIW